MPVLIVALAASVIVIRRCFRSLVRSGNARRQEIFRLIPLALTQIQTAEEPVSSDELAAELGSDWMDTDVAVEWLAGKGAVIRHPDRKVSAVSERLTAIGCVCPAGCPPLLVEIPLADQRAA